MAGKRWCAALAAVVAGAALGCAAGAAGHGPVVADAAPARLRPLALGDVTLGPGPLKDAYETNRRYLHTLEPDRYLWTFRQTAGLATPGEPYGGWEAPNCELRGHSLGHYLSACARVIAQDGDAVLRGRADYTVAELARCQAAHGNGYLSAWPEEFLDRLEAGGRVWAPYYTLHKIMVGLWEMHALAESAQALEVLRKMADYVGARCDRLDDARMQRVLNVEFGGMPEVLLNLYASTGERRYLDLARRFEHRSFLEPLARGEDALPGRHANTHLPKIAGAARAYELTGDETCRRTVAHFWDALAGAHAYATGGSSAGEHWGKPRQLAATLGNHNQEFCTSYNWLKICRYLLTWTAEPRYADMIERVFYNGILVSQHPRTGQFLYFLPLGTGSRKGHGSPFATFTCCYGTGIQSYAALAEYAYFRSDDALYVNLYVPSRVRWRREGGEVGVVQETAYPAEASTRLTVSAARPTTFALVLRVPWWAGRGATVRVNGEPWPGAEAAKAGSWLRIARPWKDGDTVEAAMPMSLAAEPMPDDAALVALRYGPLVLAGVLDAAARQPDHPAPVLTGDVSALDAWVRPVAGRPLEFRTEGQPVDLTLVPIHHVVEETYGVYWRLAPAGSAALEAYEKAVAEARARQARTLDRVVIGDAESEKAHDLAGENTQSGPFHAGTWRHAGKGGFFSYRLKVDAGCETVVAVTYWGSDAGGRIFDILADGERLATQTLANNAPGRLFVVEYPLPGRLTEGKTHVVVRFQTAPNGSVAGGVFGLATLRAK